MKQRFVVLKDSQYCNTKIPAFYRFIHYTYSHKKLKLNSIAVCQVQQIKRFLPEASTRVEDTKWNFLFWHPQTAL